MSRRYRLEEDRQNQLKLDLLEERDKLKLQKERIYAPLVWRRLECDIRIQDVKPNNYDEIIKLMVDHYYPRSLLSRNVSLIEDQVSVKSYNNRVLFCLKDHTSVIAVDEIRKDKIVGFLCTMVLHKHTYSAAFARQFPNEGEAYRKVNDLMNYLSRNSDVFEEFKCDSYIRILEVCIHPGYENYYGLEEEFMQVAYDIARTLHLSVICCIAATGEAQRRAKRMGMRCLIEFNYTEYRDKTKKMIICDPGAGNFSCALMAGEVPPLLNFDPKRALTDQPKEEKKTPEKEKEAEKPPKLTRAEKRALKITEANKAASKKKQS